MRNTPEHVSKVIKHIQQPDMHYVGLELPDEFYVDEPEQLHWELDRIEPDIAGQDIGLWPERGFTDEYVRSRQNGKR